MSEAAPHITDPSLLDRIALATNNKSYGNEMFAVVMLAPAVAAGFAAQKAIEVYGFPSSDEWHHVRSEFKHLEAEQHRLKDIAGDLRAVDMSTQAEQVDSKADTYTVLISSKKNELPRDYNPHVEGLLSGSGFFLALALTATSIAVPIARRARKLAKSH